MRMLSRCSVAVRPCATNPSGRQANSASVITHLRGVARLLTPLLLAVIGFLMVSSKTALAGEFHPYISSIVQAGNPLEPLPEPWGLTFDSEGNLYVGINNGGTGFDIFNPANDWISHGGSEISEDRGLGVSDETGDVFAAAGNVPDVVAYIPNVKGKPEDGYVEKPGQTWAGATTAAGRFSSCCNIMVAVDNSATPQSGHVAGTGDVYVLSGGGVLSVIKPGPSGEEGELVQELAVPGFLNRDGLAVDALTGDVYVASHPRESLTGELIPASIVVFNDKGEEQPEVQLPARSEPIDVAVEESTGDLYVVNEATNAVEEFEPSGKSVGRSITETTKGTPFVPVAVAVGSNGDVYISDNQAKSVDIYGPLQKEIEVPIIKTGPAHEINKTAFELTGEVNPEGLTLSGCSFEYATAEEYKTRTKDKIEPPYSNAQGCRGSLPTGSTPVPVSAELDDLEPHTIYHFRLGATGSFPTTYGEDEAFETPPAPPVIESTSAAPGPSPRKAELLSGVVDPKNSAIASYYFSYITQADYESGYSRTLTPTAEGGSGPTGETLGPTQISGLQSGTTYRYKLVVVNQFGEKETGPEQTFTTASPTPPLVSAGQTGEVTQTTAVVSDTIDPQELQTSYELELGTDTTYSGGRIFGTLAPGEEAITLDLGDLAPGTTYHYRILATNEDGTTEGPDQSFTTAPVSSPFTQPLAPPLIATPSSIVFPTAKGTVYTAKPLTNAQKLAKALKACKHDKKKSKRQRCEKQAHKKYPVAKKGKK